jgi:hypothetical protein
LEDVRIFNSPKGFSQWADRRVFELKKTFVRRPIAWTKINELTLHIAWTKIKDN